MLERKLKNKRLCILAADGFEKLELTIPVTALRLAGATVDIVSLRSGRIRGMNLHEPASTVKVTRTVSDANPADYDGLMIPGGFINPDLLRQSEEVRAFVRTFDEAGKPIASLCHGPWVLASSGLLRGRTVTSWPGVRDDLVNAGASWLNQEVVKDGNLVTSRGPEDLKAFTKAIIDHFAQTAPFESSISAEAESASQATEPPQMVLSAFKYIPRPSFRTIGLVAAAGVGLLGLTSQGKVVRSKLKEAF